MGHGSGNYGHYGYGFYFSEHESEASGYGSNVMKCYIKITNPFKGTDSEVKKLKDMGAGAIDDEIELSIDFESLRQQVAKIDPIAYGFLNDYLSRKDISLAWETYLSGEAHAKINMDELTDIINYTDLNPNADGVPDWVFSDLENMGIFKKIFGNQ